LFVAEGPSYIEQWSCRFVEVDLRFLDVGGGESLSYLWGSWSGGRWRALSRALVLEVCKNYIINF
jgi:hypothetical protein